LQPFPAEYSFFFLPPYCLAPPSWFLICSYGGPISFRHAASSPLSLSFFPFLLLVGFVLSYSCTSLLCLFLLIRPLDDSFSHSPHLLQPPLQLPPSYPPVLPTPCADHSALPRPPPFSQAPSFDEPISKPLSVTLLAPRDVSSHLSPCPAHVSATFLPSHSAFPLPSPMNYSPEGLVPLPCSLCALYPFFHRIDPPRSSPPRFIFTSTS